MIQRIKTVILVKVYITQRSLHKTKASEWACSFQMFQMGRKAPPEYYSCSGPGSECPWEFSCAAKQQRALLDVPLDLVWDQVSSEREIMCGCNSRGGVHGLFISGGDWTSHKNAVLGNFTGWRSIQQHLRAASRLSSSYSLLQSGAKWF